MRESRQLTSHNSLILTIQRRSLMAPGGSRKGSEEHRKALKSVDFQCFFFLVKLQDNAEYYLQACTKRVHRVSCTKMYTVTRKGLQQVEDCAFAEIQL